MATRKAITLVSGLFQEVNTPSDKLDFAGNTTADLGENTNLYFTNARARGAVSVTDAGGQGSLAYNSSTGVITYTGPSSAETRGELSVASGSGLTYNSGTGEFGTSAIPNSQLANDDITIGSTAIALGATGTTIAGLTSLASTTLIAGTEDAANAIEIGSGNIIFEGSTADANETILTAADATGGDKTLTLPNETGTVLSTASSIANSNLANSAVTIGSTSVSLGATANTIAGLNTLTSSSLIATTALRSGATDAANSIQISNGTISFEGSTANAFETGITVTDPTTDRTITFPDNSGTVVVSGTGGLTVSDGGNIGSDSDPDAISISSAGVVAFSATTANTNASDGAVTVAGGVGIAADLSVGDDLRLISDSAVLSFGADSDTTLTHTDGTGLTLNSTNKKRRNY